MAQSKARIRTRSPFRVRLLWQNLSTALSKTRTIAHLSEADSLSKKYRGEKRGGIGGWGGRIRPPDKRTIYKF